MIKTTYSWVVLATGRLKMQEKPITDKTARVQMHERTMMN